MPTLNAYPLFEKHTLEEIHEKTGYALWTLLDIKQGKRPAVDRFKRLCAAMFPESQAELFGDPAQETPDA